jgi:ParB/RepB/Spo0J family partition protein
MSRELPVGDLYVTADVRYDPEKIEPAMVTSIRRHGVIEPLVVRPDGTGRFVIIDGRRRLRHAVAAGLATVPVQIRGTSSPEDEFVVSVEANLHREDWSPIDVAVIIREFTEVHGWTQAEVASWLDQRLDHNVSQPTVSQYLKLLGMCDAAKAAVAAGRFPFTWGRYLSRLNDDHALQALLVEQIEAEMDAAVARGESHTITSRGVRGRVERMMAPPEAHAEDRDQAMAAAVERAYVSDRDAGEQPAERIGDALDLDAEADPLIALYLDQAREAIAYLAEAGRLDDVTQIMQEVSE